MEEQCPHVQKTPESMQFLPFYGRKPSANAGHVWILPAPCSPAELHASRPESRRSARFNQAFNPLWFPATWHWFALECPHQILSHMCVYIYTYIYIYLYIYLYIYIYIYIYLFMSSFIYLFVYLFIYLFIFFSLVALFVCAGPKVHLYK